MFYDICMEENTCDLKIPHIYNNINNTINYKENVLVLKGGEGTAVSGQSCRCQ